MQRQFILSGQMYNNLTPELVEARERAVFLTNEYNASFGNSKEEREAILKHLLQSIGCDVHFEPAFRCEFGYNISIGNHVWIGAGVHINPGVTIGDNTIIGSGSVVTRSIPANVVAAGVPCNIIREITEKDKTGYRP